MEKEVSEVLDSMCEGNETLRSQIDEISGRFEDKTDENKDLFNSEIYARFHAFKKDNYHGKPPSNNEWGILEGFFRKAFPQYYRLIAINHKLTRDQYRLCLLLRLSFSLYAIQKVMDIDGMRTTRLKIQVNYRLFSVRKAKSGESFETIFLMGAISAI